MLDAMATTVSGYLDVAIRQLTQLDESPDRVLTLVPPENLSDERNGSAEGEPVIRLPLPPVDLAGTLDRVRDEARREADQRIAEANTERDAALGRAEAAEQDADRLRTESQRAQRTGRLRLIAVALAAAMLASGLTIVVSDILRDPSTYAVQLAAPSLRMTPDQQAGFDFQPALPADRDWQLQVQLTITPTDTAAGCTYDARLTFHVEADGKAFPSFTSQPGQLTMSQDVRIGHAGSRSLRLVVTQLTADPECALLVNPGGSQATATT